MKTFLSLLLAIVPFVSFSQPIIRSPSTTNRFMNLPSNLSVPFWNAAAGRWSNATVSAGGDAGGTNSRQGGTLAGTNLVNNPNVVTNILGAGTVTVTSNNAGTFTITGSGGGGGDQVWTNDAGVIRTLDYGTNVMFNPSLPSIPTPLAAFLFNATNYGDHAAAGLLAVQNKGTNRFRIYEDGETWIGKDLDAWFNPEGDTKLVVAESLEHVPPGDVQDVYFGSFNNTAIKEWSVYIRSASNFISLKLLADEGTPTVLEPTIDDTFPAYEFGTTVDHTSGRLFDVLNAGTRKLSVDWNGALTIASTTNHITFGATNAPPVSAVAPTKWVSVLINGEATQYKIPLYQ